MIQFVWCLQPTKKTDHGHSAHGDAHSDHHKETADSKHSEPADEEVREDTAAVRLLDTRDSFVTMYPQEAHLSEETSSEPKVHILCVLNSQLIIPQPESDSIADDEGVVVSSEDIKQSIETAVVCSIFQVSIRVLIFCP
jgi:hypothetical protein